MEIAIGHRENTGANSYYLAGGKAEAIFILGLRGVPLEVATKGIEEVCKGRYTFITGKGFSVIDMQPKSFAEKLSHNKEFK